MKQSLLTIFAVIISYASFAVGPITGVFVVCKWDTVALSDATTGGVWTSSDPTVASVDLVGTVTGVAVGTATITYTVGPSYAIQTVTVNFLSTIVGLTDLCSGISTTYTDAIPGGVWSVVPTTVASINPSTGFYTGLSGGNDTIYYTLSPGCYMSLWADVRQTPTISGTPVVALGGTRTMTGTPSGGSWTSASTNISVGTATGVVTGIAVGTATVTYFSSACMDVKTVLVTTTTGINALPEQAVTGSFSVYPDPATDHIDIAWQDIVPGMADIVMTDMAGRTVYRSAMSMSTENGKNTIWFPKLNAGMYLVNIYSSQQSYKTKLLVQR